MGKVIWRGWATDEQAANAPQPIGIIYGKNLRQSSMEEEEASTAADTLLDFYATWARLSLFSTGIVTNMDLASSRREVVNAGAQVDVRLSLMIQQPLTLSIGYASAMEHLLRARHEFMISLKILG